jgi:hypothetical protein
MTWAEASAMTETQFAERLFPAEHVPSSVKRPPSHCYYAEWNPAWFIQ